MSEPRPAAHWMDRLASSLATRQTRRQSFKAALAGAALTLPFTRAAPARGQTPLQPFACHQGCVYASHRRYDAEVNKCGRAEHRAIVQAHLDFLFGHPFLAEFKGILAKREARQCVELALLRQKADQLDNCQHPFCPNFDAKGPYGPCAETCPECCPDNINEGNNLGYVCCSACCEDGNNCCSPG